MAEELDRLESQLKPSSPNSLSNAPWLSSAQPFAAWRTSGANPFHARSIEAPAIGAPILKATLEKSFAQEVLYADVNADGIADPHAGEFIFG